MSGDTDVGIYVPEDPWEGMIDPDTGAPYEPPDDDVTAVTPEERHTLDASDFWDARPVLRHLHTFARARMVGPWAVLGAAMARVIAAVSPSVQLPATIGGEASLNLFIGLVGYSGDGKDAAQSVAASALWIDHPPFKVAPLGSGEGLSHMFMRPVKPTKDDPYPEPYQYNRAALVTIGEIDSMAALVQRQSSTLTSQLRQAAMGQQLGFFYADQAKRMIVPEHAYRLCLIAGIQPERSGILLNDAAGGTPQRFVWLPAGDPGMSRKHRRDNLTPMVWRTPDWMAARRGEVLGDEARFLIGEPDACVDAILSARESRGTAKVGAVDAVNALDSHAVLTRTKVAAAFAIMDGRVEINDEDWDLSGVIMHVSDTQRALCLRVLRREAEKSNVAKALAEADRTLVVEEHIDRTKVAKCAEAVKRVLARAGATRAAGEWMPSGKLREKVGKTHREHIEAALEALSLTGEVEAEKTEYRSQPGVRYRLT
jgi:hypothetical protein